MFWIVLYSVGVLLMGICGVGNVVLAIQHYGSHNPWTIKYQNSKYFPSELSLSWYVLYMVVVMPLLSWLGAIIELIRLVIIKDKKR